jgi:hypothetical protein
MEQIFPQSKFTRTENKKPHYQLLIKNTHHENKTERNIFAYAAVRIVKHQLCTAKTITSAAASACAGQVNDKAFS